MGNPKIIKLYTAYDPLTRPLGIEVCGSRRLFVVINKAKGFGLPNFTCHVSHDSLLCSEDLMIV